MSYRGVVRHVRYWRGQVHKWSTVYQFLGTPTSAIGVSDAQALLTADDKMCWGAGTVANGGTYECDIYNVASGGVPIASYVAFPWATPASWIAYSGASWGVATALQDPVAEAALLVEWAAGLSSSGKPVKLRKWYHAVKQSSAQGTAQSVAAADVTALTTAANAMVNVLGSKGLTLGSSTGRFAGTATVRPYLENHQMPRGRRRRTTSGDSLSFVQKVEALVQGFEAGYSTTPSLPS